MSLKSPLRVVSDDERSAVLSEEPVDLVGEPARMAEFEAMAARRQSRESAREALVVPVEVARKLPQDRAHLRRLAKRLDPLVEALYSRSHVRQPLHVREEATCLDSEQESWRRPFHPAGDGRARGQTVEGVVDLDGVEERRVMLEPAALGKALRIDTLAPVGVVPA